MTSPSAAQAASLDPTPEAGPLTVLHTGGLPQEVLATLAAALAEGDRMLAFSPAAAEAALSGGHRLALLWTPAETVLAGALAQGLSPGRTLADWAREAGALLDLFRRNRRRIVMIPGDLLAGATGGARLARRLALPQIPAQPELPAAPHLPGLLALLAAPRCAEWRDLQEELRASSLDMPDPVLTGADLEAIAAELAQWRAQAAQVSLLQDRLATGQRALDAMQAERDALRRAVGELLAETYDATGHRTTEGAETALLRDQLALVQGVLEEMQAAPAGGATAEETAALQTALATAEQNTARALAEARAAAEARLQVETGLTEALAGLEASGADLAAARAEIEDLRRELEDRRAHEAAIYRSHSWRVTAPLRRISLLLGRHRG